MTMIDSTSATKAFALGAGLVAVSAKFWVFTLGAISVIEQADTGRTTSFATYLLFTVLAVLPQLLALTATLATPERSASLLDATSGWLQRHNRVIVITISLIFATWFLIKALVNLGVI
jgi:hypothetical protein